MSGRRAIAAAVAVWALALTSIVARDAAAPPPARPAPGPAAAAEPDFSPAARNVSSAQTIPQATATNADCAMCHDDDSAARADGRPVVVKQAAFEPSVHGGFSCVDCHTDVATPEFPHPEKLQKVDCSSCHPAAVEQYGVGAHAKARAAGTDVAATCVDCHGMHDIKPSKDPQSRTYHLNIAETCTRCHGNAEIIEKGRIPSDVTKAFADSIHGRALSRSGLVVAPTCSDCHGAHDIRPASDPESRVSMARVPATCGTCHEGIQQQFAASTHGQMLASGNPGGPACQTCHTAHGIQRSESIGWQLSAIGQCGTCHADRIETFRDTFHGQVTSLGYRQVAGCADCHGAHGILPASDPQSPIARANLVKTCGKCHEGANENFVKYDPHADKNDRERSPILYYVTRFMTVLLAGVFGFFGLHTALWFGKELRVKRDRRRGVAR